MYITILPSCYLHGMKSGKVFGLAVVLGTAAAQYAPVNTSLPVVDLGYEIYRASAYNVRTFIDRRAKLQD